MKSGLSVIRMAIEAKNDLTLTKGMWHTFVQARPVVQNDG